MSFPVVHFRVMARGTEPRKGDLSKIVRARMADLKESQIDLGVKVAGLLGRPVAQQTMYKWLADPCALRPAQVFAIEVALEVPPGYFSRHCGYVPISDEVAAPAQRDTFEAIDHDPNLSPENRDLMLKMYRALLVTDQHAAQNGRD